MFCYIFRLFPKQSYNKNKQTKRRAGNNCAIVSRRGRDTFEFVEGHVTKNQPTTLLISLSKNCGFMTLHVVKPNLVRSSVSFFLSSSTINSFLTFSSYFPLQRLILRSHHPKLYPLTYAPSIVVMKCQSRHDFE